MTSGGARLNAGRKPQEGSGRSDKRGYQLTQLPACGYSGAIPTFPLPAATPREIEVWDELWRLPQGCAWALPSEAWRMGTIALYVRQRVKCEAAEVGASHIAQLHRFADQIGLTDGGLQLMGYKITEPEKAATPVSRRGSSARERLQDVVSFEQARLRADQRREDGTA